MVAETLAAGLCGGLLASGGSSGLVLGATQPGAMAALDSVVGGSVVASGGLLGII